MITKQNPIFYMQKIESREPKYPTRENHIITEGHRKKRKEEKRSRSKASNIKK